MLGFCFSLVMGFFKRILMSSPPPPYYQKLPCVENPKNAGDIMSGKQQYLLGITIYEKIRLLSISSSTLQLQSILYHMT